MDRNEFRAWLTAKRIANPEYKWTTINTTPNPETGLMPRTELLQYIWGADKENKWKFLDPDDARKMIIEQIWQVDIINGHFRNIFFRGTDPMLLIRRSEKRDKFAIVLYDGVADKKFSNITLGMIQQQAGFDPISSIDLQYLDDLDLPQSTDPTAKVRYTYQECISQTIVDVDSEGAVILSSHDQAAFWNSKLKQYIKPRRFMKAYWLEHIKDNTLTLYEILAFKDAVTDETADHSHVISTIFRPASITDLRKLPICKKLIEEVVI